MRDVAEPAVLGELRKQGSGPADPHPGVCAVCCWLGVCPLCLERCGSVPVTGSWLPKCSAACSSCSLAELVSIFCSHWVADSCMEARETVLVCLERVPLCGETMLCQEGQPEAVGAILAADSEPLFRLRVCQPPLGLRFCWSQKVGKCCGLRVCLAAV